MPDTASKTYGTRTVGGWKWQTYTDLRRGVKPRGRTWYMAIAVPSARPLHLSPRVSALDIARALGVVAMVVGHSLDALLAPAARQAPLLLTYWKARGFTAPLFLAAAGWAVTVAIRRSGAEGMTAVRRRVPRVLLLLGIGYALRWPGWGIYLLRAGDPGVWAHFLAFDALHAIALSLLAASLVLALPWTSREKGLAFALLTVLSVALGMSAPAPLPPELAALPTRPLAIALAQALGGTSPFPLFPWAGYFFVGSMLGLAGGASQRSLGAIAGVVGGALVLATAWTGVGSMPVGHPVLFAYRSGVVLVLFAALSAVPRAVAARVAPLGRASLGVYAVHVALVYGWSTYDGLAGRVGATLPLARALGVAGLVLVASLAALAAWRVALATARAAGARLGRWDRRRASHRPAVPAVRALTRDSVPVARAAGGEAATPFTQDVGNGRLRAAANR